MRVCAASGYAYDGNQNAERVSAEFRLTSNGKFRWTIEIYHGLHGKKFLAMAPGSGSRQRNGRVANYQIQLGNIGRSERI